MHRQHRNRLTVALLALVCLVLTGQVVATDAGHDAVDPEPDIKRLALGQFDYRTWLLLDDRRMEVDTRLLLSHDSDQPEPELSIEALIETGMGRTRDRLFLDAGTLRPKRRAVEQNDGEMSVEYGESQLLATLRTGQETVQVDLPLDAAVYAGEIGLDITLATLPLASGYQTQLNVVEVDVNSQVRRFAVEVEPLETVQIEIGEFQAWPVRLEALDGQGGDQWLWFSDTEPRYLIRAEASIPGELGDGMLVTELRAKSINAAND
ncbi:MAG: DUF3108 domain-containing protein [Wenzhouxiangella sp.]